ncbi:MAG: hypothetical protein ACRDT4_10960 [Micromonosporaceae bacterium]
MTHPVTIKLPAQYVEAAKRMAKESGTTVSALTAQALRAEILRHEFAEHAAMVRAAEADDPDRLRRRATAYRDGLSRWKDRGRDETP